MSGKARNAIRFLKSYGPLFFLTVIVSLFSCAYVYLGIGWNALAELLATWLLPIGFSTWVQADAKAARRTPCYDFGMFIYGTWILSVPLYLVWTRGWRGVAITAMFFCMLVTPYLTATLLWTLLYQQ